MTLLVEPPKAAIPAIAMATPSAGAAHPCPRYALLLRIFDTLEREGIPACVLHGYEGFPGEVNGDVDCLISEQFFPHRVASVLFRRREEIGAKVVQWFVDGAHFIVLAGKSDSGSPVLLQLHVSTRYEMAGRIFLTADQVLANRTRRDRYWTPAPDVEFACIISNRIAKLELKEKHARKLSSLYDAAPQACHQRLTALFADPSSRDLIETAARTDNWSTVQPRIIALRDDLLNNPLTPRAGSALSRMSGKISRWVCPRNGFHAVFLGPDGVGKSTTIETFQHDLKAAFLHDLYLTFAPGLLPQKFAPPKPGGPHSLPPRSLPASLLKAAWWTVCYTLGYMLTIRPTLSRGGLVVNHRYLVDAIVDQRRYRYSGPVWLLKLIWKIAPKPDVVFLLDAPPELIQTRKQEVTLEETTRQVEAYRSVITRLPMGRIIDAARPREQVAADVEWRVLDAMAHRTGRQFGIDFRKRLPENFSASCVERNRRGRPGGSP